MLKAAIKPGESPDSGSKFFVNNEYLNSKFPLAACPLGSLDDMPESDWYIHDLSKRFLAALYIGDELTMMQLRARLEIHKMCRMA